MRKQTNSKETDEEELRKAFSEGDFITVGLVSQTKKLIPVVDLDDTQLDIPFYQYNTPIGIDFNKSVSPTLYLLQVALLEKALKIEVITKEYHFLIETLLNNLLLGKIIEYHSELENQLNKFYQVSDIEILKKDFNAQSLILVNLLAFLLQTNKNEKIKWITHEDMKNYLFNKEKRKIYLKEWQLQNASCSSQIQFLLYCECLEWKIFQNIPSKSVAADWLQIRNSIRNSEFAEALKMLVNLITISPIIDLNTINKTDLKEIQQKNDLFFQDLIKGLWILDLKKA